jgi:CRP-like cAMP-binding protein
LIAVLSEGQSFGELAMGTGRNSENSRLYSAIAATDTLVVTISKQEFDKTVTKKMKQILDDTRNFFNSIPGFNNKGRAF